jgi:hypothetical protein
LHINFFWAHIIPFQHLNAPTLGYKQALPSSAITLIIHPNIKSIISHELSDVGLFNIVILLPLKPNIFISLYYFIGVETATKDSTSSCFLERRRSFYCWHYDDHDRQNWGFFFLSLFFFLLLTIFQYFLFIKSLRIDSLPQTRDQILHKTTF